MGKFLSQTSMSHLTSRQMSSTSTSTAMPAHKGGCRSSLPNIPLDIYGLIIDEYVSSCQPAEKMKSLKNLSMTNRSFRAVFYPHLFSRLCLNHEYDHKDRPFLVSAPNIAKFARKLNSFSATHFRGVIQRAISRVNSLRIYAQSFVLPD